MNNNRILALNSVLNLRTLGGLKSGAAGAIRPNILYRSAALDKLNAEDAAFLRDRCGVDLVIDLRTDAEAQKSPDKQISGVTYMHLPVSANALPGVSRELEPGKNATSEMMPDMREMYERLVREPEYIENFSRILHTIIEHRGGAVLWHCTAGKDRCGLTAYFLSCILGVDQKNCREDYMLTNRAFLPIAVKYFILISIFKQDIKLAKKVFSAYAARECYLTAGLNVIEKDFGGMDAYIKNQLKISDEEKEAFRAYALGQ